MEAILAAKIIYFPAILACGRWGRKERKVDAKDAKSLAILVQHFSLCERFD